MGRKDTRPPPSVCAAAESIIGRPWAEVDLREFAELEPHKFELLLYHSRFDPDCEAAIKQVFPNGFISDKEAEALEEGLREVEQLLEPAEEPPNQNAAEGGELGTATRGGGA